MSKQNAVCAFVAAALTAVMVPVMPAMAQMAPEAPAQDSEATPPEPTAQTPEVAAPSAPAATTGLTGEVSPEQVLQPIAAPAIPASGSLLAAPASGSLIALPASGSVIAAPQKAASASATPVAGPGFSLPNLKLPFPLSVSLRPETGSTGGAGFAEGVPVIAGTPGAPAMFNLPAKSSLQAMTGKAEIGLLFLTLGGQMSNFGSMGTFDPSISAADSNNKPQTATLPYYWPESSWATYVKAFGLRFGYLNESFAAGGSQPAANIGSFVGGLDGGLSLFGLLGVDYHALAGWGVSGQNAPGTTTSHVPAEAEASAYVNLGPVNLRAGYVARATFTGDPSTFLTVLTNPMSLASDAVKGDNQKLNTVNATRLGTYQGPFFGVGFNF